MILLDSDIMTHFAAGHAQVTQRVLNAPETVAITIITRIEILQGRFSYLLKAEDGNHLERAQQLLERSERTLAKMAVVPIDASAAAEFDQLRQNKKLKKIGRNDLLIASIALAQRSLLATRNLKHFQQVPGLKVENWAD